MFPDSGKTHPPLLRFQHVRSRKCTRGYKYSPKTPPPPSPPLSPQLKYPPTPSPSPLSRHPRWVSGHLDDLHAARKAGLFADFAQLFPGPALGHGLLELHLAAPPLELLLSTGLLVPAVPPVPRLGPGLVPQSDLTAACHAATAKRWWIRAGASKQAPAAPASAAGVRAEVPAGFAGGSAGGLQVHPTPGGGGGGVGGAGSGGRLAEPWRQPVLSARALACGAGPTNVEAEPMGGRARRVPVLPPLPHLGLQQEVGPTWPVGAVHPRGEGAEAAGARGAVQLAEFGGVPGAGRSRGVLPQAGGVGGLDVQGEGAFQAVGVLDALGGEVQAVEPLLQGRGRQDLRGPTLPLGVTGGGHRASASRHLLGLL